jgi:MOSC domain-containing protein YiiM
MEGTVRALFVMPHKGAKPDSRTSVEVQTMGFDGDHHTGFSKSRQVLLMSGSILDALQLEPGAIYENVVIDGFDVMSLTEGQQIRMGNAMFEVTIPCEPCGQMDRVRRGLKSALMDRRGMFVRVVTPGAIHVGDAVSVSNRAGD